MLGLRIRLQPKQSWLYRKLVEVGSGAATIIGMGGAKGCGKSAGADNCAVLLALELGAKYPGIKITIVRRVFGDLDDNHIKKMRERFPQLDKYYASGDKEYRLQHGPVRASILFRYAETEEDVRRKFLGGFESAIIIVDEAQQFSQRELQWIQAAARWTDSEGLGVPIGLCKALLLFNPGGKGSGYIRRIFWLRKYEGEEKPHQYTFMHSFGWDNFEWFRGQVDIGEEEFYSIQSKCDVEPADREHCRCCRFHMFIYQTSEGIKYNGFPPSIRTGYLLGSFDDFEGQYFAGAWDESKCVLTREQVATIVKPWWIRWMAQDWGFGDHAAHGWFAAGRMSPTEWMRFFGGYTDSDVEVCVLYREHVIAGRAEGDLADDIVNMTPREERRQIERFFLSQDAFGQRAKQSGANTVGERFAATMDRAGMPRPETADQERVTGFRFVYGCLSQACLVGATFDRERALRGPAFFVSSECPVTIESIPQALRDDRNIEDVVRVAGAVWEDCTDMVRYGLKSRLASKWEAPEEVRRAEVFDRYDQPERTGPQMTSLALAMRRFDSAEKRRYQRVKLRR